MYSFPFSDNRCPFFRTYIYNNEADIERLIDAVQAFLADVVLDCSG